jgi:outer membrane protein TolC
MNITVVEPITPLWSVFNGYKAASLGHDIAEIQAKLTSEQLKMEVINLFYNYQMLSESAEILNKTKEQLERYKTKAQNFVDAGLTDKRSVLKIEIELAKIEQQVMIVAGNIKLIKKNLSIFMNRDVNSFTLQVENTPSNSLSAANDALSEMMKKSRLELKMLNKSNKIAKHLEWTAIQPLIPTLAVAGGYQRTWDASTFQPEGTLFIGGTLSWNVGFDWGSAIFNYKKARAERIKTELDNIAAKKAMEVQLIQLENDVNTKSQAITIAKKEIESAQENLRIEEDKYNQKLTTETELLDASIALRSAKLKLLTSVYEHEVALNRLAITIGVPYEEITN